MHIKLSGHFKNWQMTLAFNRLIVLMFSKTNIDAFVCDCRKSDIRLDVS